MKPTPLLLAMADLEAGVVEIPGTEHHPRILEYHRNTTLGAAKDEVSWCSAAVCTWHEEAGIPSTRSAAARSWLEWGIPIRRQKAQPGDVCVFWRESRDSWKGHVALLADIPTNPLQITCVGGNQREGGADRVCLKDLLVDKLLDIRRWVP